MAEPNARGRLASGAIWAYATHAGGLVSVFAGLAILARLLTPHEFGLFGMAMAAVGFFEVAKDLGLRTALIYFGAEDDRSDGAVYPTGFLLNLGVGAAIAALLLIVSIPAAAFYETEAVTPLIQALSVYYVLSALGAVPDAILRRRLDFRRRFFAEVASPVGRYTVAILLALRGFGAWSLVGGQLAGIGLSVVLYLVLADWWPRLRFRMDAARKLLGYGGQMSVVDLMAALALNLDYALVGRFLGSTSLGLYTLAFKLPEAAVMAVAYATSHLLLPSFVEVRDDPARFRAMFLQACRYLALVLTPATAGLCVLAPVLVSTFFGDQWTEAAPVLQLLAVGSFVRGMLFAAGSAFIAAGRPPLLILAQAAWIGALIPGLYLGAQISLQAVALAHIVAGLVFGAIKLPLVNRLLGIGWSDLARSVAPGVVGTAVMVPALLALLHLLGDVAAPIVAALGVAVGAAVYGGAIGVLDPGAARQVRFIAGGMLGRS